MWAGKIQFERVHSRVLHDASQFLPASLVVLFHDGSDQNMIRIVFFNLAKFLEPDFDRAIRDEFDVFETDHFTIVARTQFAVARYDVDDFARLEADGLGDRAAPAGVEGFCDNARVGSRRAGTE